MPPSRRQLLSQTQNVRRQISDIVNVLKTEPNDLLKQNFYELITNVETTESSIDIAVHHLQLFKKLIRLRKKVRDLLNELKSVNRRFTINSQLNALPPSYQEALQLTPQQELLTLQQRTNDTPQILPQSHSQFSIFTHLNHQPSGSPPEDVNMTPAQSSTSEAS